MYLSFCFSIVLTQRSAELKAWHKSSWGVMQINRENKGAVSWTRANAMQASFYEKPFLQLLSANNFTRFPPFLKLPNETPIQSSASERLMALCKSFHFSGGSSATVKKSEKKKASKASNSPGFCRNFVRTLGNWESSASDAPLSSLVYDSSVSINKKKNSFSKDQFILAKFGFNEATTNLWKQNISRTMRFFLFY